MLHDFKRFDCWDDPGPLEWSKRGCALHRAGDIDVGYDKMTSMGIMRVNDAGQIGHFISVPPLPSLMI
ncbi:hypothetical protein TWF696_006056 [Orbilia brochopaga]|uniref:Uncharacterized protein n=1 Tax=Orbilia brochopaga TaxID=3140254 RepID=A0AAV9UXU6_9PEZI